MIDRIVKFSVWTAVTPITVPTYLYCDPRNIEHKLRKMPLILLGLVLGQVSEVRKNLARKLIGLNLDGQSRHFNIKVSILLTIWF